METHTTPAQEIDDETRGWSWSEDALTIVSSSRALSALHYASFSLPPYRWSPQGLLLQRRCPPTYRSLLCNACFCLPASLSARRSWTALHSAASTSSGCPLPLQVFSRPLLTVLPLIIRCCYRSVFALASPFSTLVFIILAGMSIYYVLSFRRGGSPDQLPPDGNGVFPMLLLIAFAFKLGEVLYLIMRQNRIDIFFVDAEKPRLPSSNASSTNVRFGPCLTDIWVMRREGSCVLVGVRG